MRSLFMNLLVRYPVLAWMLGVVGVVLIFVGIGQLRAFHHLQDTGVTAQGTLTSITGDPDSKADVEYSFDVAGKRYKGQSEVGANDRANRHPGDKVEVRYLAENPTQNLMGAAWPSTPYGIVLGGVGMMIMPLAVTVKRRREGRQQRAG